MTIEYSKRLNIKHNHTFLYVSDTKEFYHNGKIIICNIDESDYELLSQYGWYISKKGYVYTMIKNHTRFLHRMVLNLYENKNPNVVDHINGNKLNNCKDNLRIVSNYDNLKYAWYEQCLYNDASKQIGMYSSNSDYVMSFDSQKIAEKWVRKNTKYVNASQGNISNACTGRVKMAYGYRWKFHTEVNENALYGK